MPEAHPARPTRIPLLHQRWSELLFAHWPTAPEVLRPYLPPRLELDLFEGQAWLGVVPFSMSQVRPPGLPAVPGLRSLHELNVRTYAHLDGIPGVWFLSLDANSPVAVELARGLFHLPYLHARMSFIEQADGLHFQSVRTHRRMPPATFAASWTPGAALPPAQPGSLEYFLTERYHLYTSGPNLMHDIKGTNLWRGTLWHEPWPLRQATLHHWDSTLVESHGLPTPVGPPHLLAADGVDVRVMGLKRV
ncbi:YqjF family protein [Hymenobacter wooponensis]|uniref:DUF2071 domain-containing protein n=1 Tax=Hymenobacter wooponensis TaxID=1525360 RepID=A0A4Z0MUW2_9BACT|nr:DUF2071 domain-containing protein [Hymenobacter wooponensis]TGD83098.1 DUF2071 domain-containing protein [Hymenobacter wooponensis]